MDSTISRLIGEKALDLIPSDAKEIETEEDEMDASAEKANVTKPELPLIEPVVALVAPDATPHALEPLHPSQIPEPEQKTEVPLPAPAASTEPAPPNDPNKALQVMLGMSKGSSNPSAAPIASVESMLSIPSTVSLNETDIMGAAMKSAPPAPVDIKKTMDVYRQFGGPRT